MSDLDSDTFIDLTDETPVTVEMPTGALAALCLHLITVPDPCPNRCDAFCEVRAYQYLIAKRIVSRILADLAGVRDDFTADLAASNRARLDQWKADMVARGVWS